MAKEQIRMIPVKRDTEEMLKYVGRNYKYEPDGNDYYKWVQNHMWSDTINIVGMERGQSSAHFIVKSEVSGKTYYMFMKDLLNMILNHTIEKGRISGCFTYVQRGKNYGIKIC